MGAVIARLKQISWHALAKPLTFAELAQLSLLSKSLKPLRWISEQVSERIPLLRQVATSSPRDFSPSALLKLQAVKRCSTGLGQPAPATAKVAALGKLLQLAYDSRALPTAPTQCCISLALSKALIARSAALSALEALAASALSANYSGRFNATEKRSANTKMPASFSSANKCFLIFANCLVS